MPVLTTPPAGIHGHPLWDSWHELESWGYTQAEYLVSGTARALDGTTAPYTTRMVVIRPKSQKRFNGAVFMDWANVTAQFENANDIGEGRELLLREGWAFVHVSAQAAGVCCNPLTPQGWDPVRYAALDHPGDAYAADMFSQLAKALKSHVGLDPMRGLRVERLIAGGQSQSAGKLYDYVVNWQASANVIDGFLIHGSGSAPKTFPKPLTVPVFFLHADREARPVRSTKDKLFRLWEVAGTGHSGYFLGTQSVQGHSLRVADQPPLDRSAYNALMEQAGNYGQVLDPRLGACIVYGSTMPMHYSVNAALHELDRWVRTGKRPVRAPRYEFEGGELARDADGNTLGGIRLPPIEVPVASYESTSCDLGGITVPFTDQQIQERYPTFNHYQRLMKRATNRAVKRGWLLRPDAKDMMRRVCAVQSRYLLADAGTCKAESYKPPKFRSKPRGPFRSNNDSRPPA
jgi:hypothetical protein